LSVFQGTSVAVAGAKVDPLFTFTRLFIIYFPSFLKLFLNTLITQNLTTCLFIDFRNFLIWDVFFVIPVLKQLLLLLTSQLYWADIDFFTTSISIFLGKFDTKTQSSFLSRKGANTQSLFFWSGFSLLNVYLENYCPCPDIPETSRGNPFVSVKIAIRRHTRLEHPKASKRRLSYSLKLIPNFLNCPTSSPALEFKSQKQIPI